MPWFQHKPNCPCAECRLDKTERLLRTLVDGQRYNLHMVREIRGFLRDIRDTLRPRPRSLTVHLAGGVMLNVGQTTVATVNGFDQNGNPMPLDFATLGAPQWSLSDPALAAATPNATDPNQEDVTGVAAGSVTLSVSLGGLSASLSFDVVAPAPVLTSLTISTEPAV